MPGISVLNFEGESCFDGIVDFIPDSFIALKVAIIDLSECLLVPFVHGVGDHIVGLDNSMACWG